MKPVLTEEDRKELTKFIENALVLSIAKGVDFDTDLVVNKVESLVERKLEEQKNEIGRRETED